MFSVFCQKRFKGGLVSSDGRVLLPFNPSRGIGCIAIGNPSEGLVFCEQHGKVFAITEEGSRIEYDDITLQNPPWPQLRDGLAAMCDVETDKYGYINRSGSWIIPPRFEMAGDFRDGLAMIFNCESKRTYEVRGGKRKLIRQTVKNPMYGIINRTGKLLHTLPVDNVPFINPTDRGWPDDLFEFVGEIKLKKSPYCVPCIVRNLSEVHRFPNVKELRPCYRGVVGCRTGQEEQSSWELRTTRNVLIVKEEFENLGFWSSGLCPAKDKGQGWGAIDTNGRWVIKPEYDHLRMFQHGLADGKKDGRFVVITPNNRVILKCDADYVEVYPDRILVVNGDRILLHDLQGKLLHTIRVK
jgi:hypothetical protein